MSGEKSRNLIFTYRPTLRNLRSGRPGFLFSSSSSSFFTICHLPCSVDKALLTGIEVFEGTQDGRMGRLPHGHTTDTTKRKERREKRTWGVCRIYWTRGYAFPSSVPCVHVQYVQRIPTTIDSEHDEQLGSKGPTVRESVWPKNGEEREVGGAGARAAAMKHHLQKK